jgi:hypothetical protein
MTFIADHADLVSTDVLRVKIRHALGWARTPSRSQLSRLVKRVREDDRRAYAQLDAAGGRLE